MAIKQNPNFPNSTSGPQLDEDVDERFAEQQAADDDDQDDDDDDQDDDDGGRETSDEFAQPQDRKARRRDRGKLYAANKEMKAELETLRGQLSQLAQVANQYPAADEVRQALYQRQQQQQQAPEDRDLEMVLLKTEQMTSQYRQLQAAGQMTPERDAEFRRYAIGLDNAAASLRVRKELRIAQQNQPSQEAIAHDMQMRMIRTENADVYENERARRLLIGQWNIRIGQGATAGRELHDECADYARKALGMRPRSAPSRPTKAQQSRYTGMGSAGGGAPQAGDGDDLRPTRAALAMAAAAYPEIKDEKKRFRVWKKKVMAARQKNS